MSARDIALANEILRGVVGSTAHGTAIDAAIASAGLAPALHKI
jgi:hypothetical protein